MPLPDSGNVAISQQEEVSDVDGSVGEQYRGTIWDEVIVKVNKENGKKTWTCKYCGKSFKDLHATKAVCHLSQQKRKGVNVLVRFIIIVIDFVLSLWF